MRTRSSHPRSVCACVAVSIVGLRPKPRRDMGWLNAPMPPKFFFSGRPKNFPTLAPDLNQKVQHTICRSICGGENLCWLVRSTAVCSARFRAFSDCLRLRPRSRLLRARSTHCRPPLALFPPRFRLADRPRLVRPH